MASLDEARMYWEYLLNNMAYEGATPALSENALVSISQMIDRKRVGKFDELMTDEQVLITTQDKSLLMEVHSLIVAWFNRTIEAHNFETAPTEIEDLKQSLQVASQILKVCRVSSNPDFDKPE